MTLPELDDAIRAITGHQLTRCQMHAILDAIRAYATGDSGELQAARREVLQQAADDAWGTGYGRNRKPYRGLRCEVCQRPITQRKNPGRIRKYCSNACRVKAQRRKQVA